jgi:hypothetical protein
MEIAKYLAAIFTFSFVCYKNISRANLRPIEKGRMDKKNSIEAYKFVVQKYLEEYNEYSDIWKTLDVKAQGTVVVAGVFIAGIFTLVSKMDNATDYTKLVFTLVVIFLVLTVIICINAMRIKETEYHPSVEELRNEVDELVQAEGPVSEDGLMGIYKGVSIKFSEVNEDILRVLSKKAETIKTSQGFLILSGMIAGLGILIRLWSLNAPPK